MIDWFIPPSDHAAAALKTPASQLKKGRVTLSMSDSVKEAAAAYAELHGTSVSAIVEAHLCDLVTDDNSPIQTVTDDDVARLGSVVVTGPGSPFGPPKEHSGAAAFFESGEFLFNKTAPNSHAEIRVNCALRQAGYVIKEKWPVSEAVISALNGGGAKAAESHLLKTQRSFLELLRLAMVKGHSRIEIKAANRSEESTCESGNEGSLYFLTFCSAHYAHDICAAAFHMSFSKDCTYRPLEYQSGRINDCRSPLPDGLTEVLIQWCPLRNGGRVMSCALVRSEEPMLLEDIGFQARDLTAVRRAASLRTGLCIVTGWDGQGVSMTAASIMQFKHGLQQGRKLCSIEEQNGMTIPGVLQFPVLDASNLIERQEKLRQAVTCALNTRPDAVLINGRFDKATGWLAVESASQGVQVVTVQKSNDAHAAIMSFADRLNLSSSSFVAGGFPLTVIWQQLLRVPCPECSLPAIGYAGPRSDALHAELAQVGMLPDGVRIRNSGGCPSCGGSGWATARNFVCEVLQPDEEFMVLLSKGDLRGMRDYSADRGFRPALHQAAEFVSSGEADPFDVMDSYGRLKV